MTKDNGEMLKPCPNPWCIGGPALPAALTLKRSGWRVLCGCGVSTFRCETEAEAIAVWNTRATSQALQAEEWQGIETAPEGNSDDGPFFDVAWAGSMHRYLPVPRRETDCYRRGTSICREHGYPSVTTVFLDPPTHWRPLPSPPATGGDNG